MEIDYSDIPEVTQVKINKWVPPRHVYFGPKDVDGTPLPEPVYSHIEFPRMLYLLAGEKIKARIVNSQEEMDSLLTSGWEKNPIAFGLVTAPSFDQYQSLKIDDKRGPGRPKKETA